MSRRMTKMPSRFRTIEVYHAALGGASFIRKGLLLSPKDLAGNIRTLIRNIIKEDKPGFRYLDSEITLVKTACGTTLDAQLFDNSVSSLGHVFE